MVDSGEPIDLVKIKCDSTEEDFDHGVSFTCFQEKPKDLSCKSPHRDFNLNLKIPTAAPTSICDDIFKEAVPTGGGNLLGRLFSPDRLLAMLQGLRACEEHLKSLSTSKDSSPHIPKDVSPSLDLSKPFPLTPTDLSLKPPPTPDSASDLTQSQSQPQSQPLDFSARRLEPMFGFGEIQRKIWHAMATSSHPLPCVSSLPSVTSFSNPW